MTLYYRDPIECVEFLFGNPLFADHMEYVPEKLYTAADKLKRVYAGWMTSDSAWEMQVRV